MWPACACTQDHFDVAHAPKHVPNSTEQQFGWRALLNSSIVTLVSIVQWPGWHSPSPVLRSALGGARTWSFFWIFSAFTLALLVISVTVLGPQWVGWCRGQKEGRDTSVTFTSSGLTVGRYATIQLHPSNTIFPNICMKHTTRVRWTWYASASNSTSTRVRVLCVCVCVCERVQERTCHKYTS